MDENDTMSHLETDPLLFLESKGRGVYILTELIYTTWAFAIIAFFVFLYWLGGKGD